MRVASLSYDMKHVKVVKLMKRIFLGQERSGWRLAGGPSCRQAEPAGRPAALQGLGVFRHALLTFFLAALAFAIGVGVAAQATPPPAPPQTPAQGVPPATAGRQGRAGGELFPAQQRPPGDPAVIARGKMLYEVACTSCHGIDLRGGQLNGPNLLRSQLVLNDLQGELILPIVQGARAEKGMPAVPIPPEDVKAIAEYIHSVVGASRGQGAPPRGSGAPPDVLVGDAAAGEKYFTSACSRCHSLTGDLQGIGSRFTEAKALQNYWVSGGRVGGRGSGRSGGRAGGTGAAPPRAVTATISLPGNEQVEGRVLRYDDFLITLVLADETLRSFRRDGDTPKVEFKDPFEIHRALLPEIRNKDMRDLTAYLWTVK
jgi:cytochrome c oxidase cbb3-type subunit III